MTEQATASAGAALARRQATAGKVCTGCGQHRPLSAFGADARNPSGLASRERACRSPGPLL